MMTIFDVGAHRGGYAKCVRRFNDSARIVAFEPHPTTFKVLQENIKDLNIETYNIALGNRSDVAMLYDYKQKGGSEHASLYESTIADMYHEETQCYRVGVDTIDDVMSRLRIASIDLLKIDTEGNELAVLQGAISAIKERRIKVIQFEFNATDIYSRVFLRDFFELLEGYKFYRLIQDGKIAFNKYDALTCEIFAFQNIVAIRSDFAAVID